MSSIFDNFYDPAHVGPRVLAPRLNQSMTESDAKVWSGIALAPCLPQLERILMLSASAPVALDRLIGMDAVARGDALVKACMVAVRECPEVGLYIRGAGEALKADKFARADPSSSAKPAMRQVQRGSAVLVRPRDAADAMDMAPSP